MPPPDALKPYIEMTPPDVQSFLNAGGWIVGLVLLAVVAWLLLWAVVRLLFRRRRKPPVAVLDLTEDLATYPPPPALWGSRRLTVYDLPVRLRLVVAAPLGTEAGALHEEDIERMLDLVIPGLSAFLKSDKPRIRAWPTQLSHQGFTAAFRRFTLRPDPENPVSRWVLVMGKALIGRRPVAIGFACLADRDNTLSRVVVEQPHQWMEAMRIKG
jgi:hypothetical protein